jgi:hypothetical protein
MGKKTLDIRVFMKDDYVYMSAEDWQKIVKVLNNISHSCSISEDEENRPKIFTDDKIH